MGIAAARNSCWRQLVGLAGFNAAVHGDVVDVGNEWCFTEEDQVCAAELSRAVGACAEGVCLAKMAVHRDA